MTLFWFIALSTVWFLLLAFIKSALSWKFCVACVAVSSSWMALLVMEFTGKEIDPILVGILMGESVVGLYYFLEKRVPTAWQIFRWPYLVTASAVVYLLLGEVSSLTRVSLLISIIWVIFVLVYLIRNIPGCKKIADKIIACCRDW